MDSAIILIMTAVLITTALVLVRAKTDNKYEVKLIDLVAAILPIGIWLLSTGKLSEFGIGDFNIKFREVVNRQIDWKIVDLKATSEDIAPDVLFIGIDCKYATENKMISKENFPSYSEFEYIVIEESCEDNSQGESQPKFYGIMGVNEYKRKFLSEYTKLSAEFFFEEVKNRRLKEYAKEINLKTFVDKENAISKTISKIEALNKMEKLNIDFLPVVSDNGAYNGVVKRSDLTASILVDLSNAQ